MKRNYFYKILLSIYIISIMPSSNNNIVHAGEKDIYNLGELYYKNKQYYDTITEMERYRFLHPKGKRYRKTFLLEGLAYFQGKNYYEAVTTLSNCFNQYPKTEEAETAMLYLSYIRMLEGSSYFANQTIKEYLYIYPEGKHLEQMKFELVSSYALRGNLNSARLSAKQFEQEYPNSIYMSELRKMKLLIKTEKERPKKSIPVAVAGSIVLPGFGYFYTGNYKLGTISLLSNAALIGLIIHGVKKKNTFQIVFFSLLELTFYNNSIFGGIDSVKKYNGQEKINKEIRLGIKNRF